MWWALIEEIALRVKEMACEKEVACVRGYQVYKDIRAAAIGEVLVCTCSREPTNAENYYIRVKYFCTILCTKIFLQQNKSEIR